MCVWGGGEGKRLASSNKASVIRWLKSPPPSPLLSLSLLAGCWERHSTAKTTGEWSARGEEEPTHPGVVDRALGRGLHAVPLSASPLLPTDLNVRDNHEETRATDCSTQTWQISLWSSMKERSKVGPPILTRWTGGEMTRGLISDEHVSPQSDGVSIREHIGCLSSKSRQNKFVICDHKQWKKMWFRIINPMNEWM